MEVGVVGVAVACQGRPAAVDVPVGSEVGGTGVTLSGSLHWIVVHIVAAVVHSNLVAAVAAPSFHFVPQRIVAQREDWSEESGIVAVHQNFVLSLSLAEVFAEEDSSSGPHNWLENEAWTVETWSVRMEL